MLLKKNYYKSFLRKLASLRLAIGLLFLIGILISIGTIIEQDQPIIFYKENYPDTNPLFGFFTWRYIIYLGLDHLYSAFWFLSILTLFALSLIACTFTTQLPALKKFRLWQFLDRFNKLKRLGIFKELKRKNFNIAAYRLYGENYHLFRQGRKTYSYSGLLGRVGPVIVHFSIIILLIGTSWGALSGYNIQEIIPRGEITHLQNLIKRGPTSYLSNNTVLRINDFWITYIGIKNKPILFRYFTIK
jgi:cytochrome c biogenesis protein